MCVIRDTAKSVINQLVKDQEEFTVYDITEEVRSLLPNITVYHYKLRDYLHEVLQEFVDSGKYIKAQDFIKHPNGPFVYKPDPLFGNIVAAKPKTITTNTNVNQSWQKTFHYGKKPSGSKYWNKRDDKGRFTR